MPSGLDPFPLGDTGPSNCRDGEFAGPLFPEWGDPQGHHGQLVMMRMQAVSGNLPQAPFLFRKSVESYLGVKIDGAYPEKGGSTYVLKLRNKNHAEKLKKMSTLADGFPITIVEHPVLNVSKCVISCSDICAYSDEELVEELKDQGVKEVRRITRRDGNQRISTPTIILTIHRHPRGHLYWMDPMPYPSVLSHANAMLLLLGFRTHANPLSASEQPYMR